jgi:RimJ/RimL family protein N-acetyltransferase
LQSKIEIKSTMIDDAKDLYDWRMDAQTKKFSFNGNEFSFVEHLQWLRNKISSKSNMLLTGFCDGKRVGFVRFELDPKKKLAWISININPECRGKGFAKALLKKSIRVFRAKHSERVIAEVMVANKVSVQAFLSVGFKIQSLSNGIIALGYK